MVASDLYVLGDIGCSLVSGGGDDGGGDDEDGCGDSGGCEDDGGGGIGQVSPKL